MSQGLVWVMEILGKKEDDFGKAGDLVRRLFNQNMVEKNVDRSSSY